MYDDNFDRYALTPTTKGHNLIVEKQSRVDRAVRELVSAIESLDVDIEPTQLEKAILALLNMHPSEDS